MRERRSRPQEVAAVPGRRPVLEALKAGQPIERILVARGLAPSSVIGDIRRRASRSEVSVQLVAKEEVDRAAGVVNHQGVVALAGRYRYASLRSVLTAPRTGVLFLDGVMDPHNLGSLLRSADGAGFSGVVLPARRAAGVTASVRRVSAGASEVMRVARVDNLGHALDEARSAGLWVAALDEEADNDLWTTTLLDPPAALVLGAEDRGLSKGVRAHCDGFVSIPSQGKLGSLNVASAGAVAMFELRRRALINDAPEGRRAPGSTLGQRLE